MWGALAHPSARSYFADRSDSGTCCGHAGRSSLDRRQRTSAARGVGIIGTALAGAIPAGRPSVVARPADGGLITAGPCGALCFVCVPPQEAKAKARSPARAGDQPCTVTRFRVLEASLISSLVTEPYVAAGRPSPWSLIVGASCPAEQKKSRRRRAQAASAQERTQVRPPHRRPIARTRAGVSPQRAASPLGARSAHQVLASFLLAIGSKQKSPVTLSRISQLSNLGTTGRRRCAVARRRSGHLAAGSRHRPVPRGTPVHEMPAAVSSTRASRRAASGSRVTW